jgi:hypothetical protein
VEKKIFVTYETVRNNALKLAHKLYASGYVPTLIYISLRGGAYLGNVISEYYKLRRQAQPPIFYAAVVARSYSQVGQRTEICLDGWTYNPDLLKPGNKILLVDDIFDSGLTLNYLVKMLLEKGLRREDIKIAVHDYKIRTYLKEQLAIQPDLYCNKYVINVPDADFWIHYLSHELLGLTKEEIEQYYLKDNPDLADVFTDL